MEYQLHWHKVWFRFWFVLFVCLGFYVPFENFSLNIYGDITIAGEGLQILTYARHSWPLSSENSLAHLLLHRASFYNGHLQGPVTLTPIAEHLAVELSLPVFMTWVSCGWDSNTQPSPMRGKRSYPLRHRRSKILIDIYTWIYTGIIFKSAKKSKPYAI